MLALLPEVVGLFGGEEGEQAVLGRRTVMEAKEKPGVSSLAFWRLQFLAHLKVAEFEAEGPVESNGVFVAFGDGEVELGAA